MRLVEALAFSFGVSAVFESKAHWLAVRLTNSVGVSDDIAPSRQPVEGPKGLVQEDE
jgi:hypothetical protein